MTLMASHLPSVRHVPRMLCLHHQTPLPPQCSQCHSSLHLSSSDTASAARYGLAQVPHAAQAFDQSAGGLRSPPPCSHRRPCIHAQARESRLFQVPFHTTTQANDLERSSRRYTQSIATSLSLIVNIQSVDRTSPNRACNPAQGRPWFSSDVHLPLTPGYISLYTLPYAFHFCASLIIGLSSFLDL